MNYSLSGTDLNYISSGWYSFIIPADIVTIKNNCFCQSKETIESITFAGRNIETIEISAFESCSKLKTLDLSQCPLLKNIGWFAFVGTALTELYFPPSCPISWAGYQKSMISSFVVATNHQRFITDNGIIYSKDKKTLHLYPPRKIGSAFSIPSSVEIIDGCAFLDSINIMHVRFPKSCTTISQYAFSSSKIINICIPDTITFIGYNAFEYCSNLKTVEIHANLTSLDKEVFRYCSSLSDIFICGAPTIGNNTFYACTSLGTIHADESIIAEIKKQANYKPKRSYETCKSKRITYKASLLVMVLIVL